MIIRATARRLRYCQHHTALLAVCTREWRVISTKFVMALGFDWLNIDALDSTQGVALQESLYGIAHGYGRGRCKSGIAESHALGRGLCAHAYAVRGGSATVLHQATFNIVWHTGLNVIVYKRRAGLRYCRQTITTAKQKCPESPPYKGVVCTTEGTAVIVWHYKYNTLF